MKRIKARAVIALMVCLAATVFVFLLLSSLNSQAATSTIISNSTASSDSETQECGSFTKDPSTVAAALVQTGTVPCLDEFTTLTNLVACIDDYLPRKWAQDHRQGFITPTALAKTQWISVVTQMMERKCDDDVDLSEYEWGSDFAVRTVTDTGVTYCVFMETTYGTFTNAITRVTRGWGTFIYNPNYSRDLNISAPHPYEYCTAAEAVGIFEKTRSRTFLMAGAHRRANNVAGCQGGYLEADAAHNVTHTFQATIEALKGYYDEQGVDFYHLQFHGMVSTSCQGVDVYMTHGVYTPPITGDKILDLKYNLIHHNETWTVTVPGDEPYCELHGAKNVPGRLLNGMPATQVCGEDDANSYSGSFIHIEQHVSDTQSCPVYRNPDNWFQAVNDTWPPSFTVVIQASDDPVLTGAQTTYTLRVTNTGETLLHLIITDTVFAPVSPTNVRTWRPTITTLGGVWSQSFPIMVEMGYVGPLTNVVQVVAEEGVRDTYTHTVSVVEEPISGLNAVNDSPTEVGNATTLTATVERGSNVTYAWAFGDGGGGSKAIVAYTYTIPGVYTAVVTASNSVSVLTTTTTVTIDEAIVGLVASNDSPTEVGKVITLTATVEAGSNVAYAWAFGDGGIGSKAVVAYTYTIPGVYPAVVTASNSVSVLTATTNVTITDVPIVGLTASNDGPTDVGNDTMLTAAIGAGSNVVYAWAFGDGITGTGRVVTHAYGISGVHTAVVTASNSVSVLTATTNVTVVYAPIVGLTASNDSPTEVGNVTTLTATVERGSNVTYTWAFGDGYTGTGKVVRYTFHMSRVYPAIVTASNSVSVLTATTIVTITGAYIYLPVVLRNH